MGVGSLNPLFVDSTKPIGDKVVTNVELLSIVLHDGDSVFFEVSDEYGFQQRFALKAEETKKSVKYTAEVWLKYQHEIQYRFVMVNGGEEVFVSATQKARAGHIISDKWAPTFKPDALREKKSKRPQQRGEAAAAAVKEAKAQREARSKPLGQPNMLSQIKSLIDDLL
ncbi:hypothetical protein DOM22_05055 [Bdellovibrio sp. ZAP7]|uniref:hypothetical protein n=1 Tax=Bdellovibrio sp. ZAP7 TaxID=2231053 RepID=UPI00115A41CC|nr:hypothetical protein [Bdellovibrio sp. ZAP7]QDK44570.1 hypothetical protein DOM22_05055 [Bdellovibrio sp. ZAP7]